MIITHNLLDLAVTLSELRVCTCDWEKGVLDPSKSMWVEPKIIFWGQGIYNVLIKQFVTLWGRIMLITQSSFWNEFAIYMQDFSSLRKKNLIMMAACNICTRVTCVLLRFPLETVVPISDAQCNI